LLFFCAFVVYATDGYARVRNYRDASTITLMQDGAVARVACGNEA